MNKPEQSLSGDFVEYTPEQVERAKRIREFREAVASYGVRVMPLRATFH